MAAKKNYEVPSQQRCINAEIGEKYHDTNRR